MNISVVIPAYNVTRYIGEALESVIDQECSVAEIVVVDDASTDETVEIIRSVAVESAKVPIRLLRNEQNRGVSFTRNRGIAAAKSDWIAFLDPDDRWFSDHTRLSMEALERGADFSYAWLEEFGEQSLVALGVIRPSGWERFTWPTSYYRRQYIYPSTLCARKSSLIALGGFDEHVRLGEDWVLMVRAVMSGMKVVEVQSVTCAMRKHTGSATANKSAVFERWLEDSESVMREYPELRRYRTAEHYRQRGYWAAHTDPFKALGWYGRAIGNDPARFGLWLRLALMIPMCLRLEFLIPPALRFLKPPQA